MTTEDREALRERIAAELFALSHDPEYEDGFTYVRGAVFDKQPHDTVAMFREQADRILALLAQPEGPMDSWRARCGECGAYSDIQVCTHCGRSTPPLAQPEGEREDTARDELLEAAAELCEIVEGLVEDRIGGGFIDSFTTRPLRTALDAARAVQPTQDAEPSGRAWRSMEDAPRDGTEVIVETRSYVRVLAHYQAGGFCIEDHPAIEEGWYYWRGHVFDRLDDPARWMPAAVAPRPEGEAREDGAAREIERLRAALVRIKRKCGRPVEYGDNAHRCTWRQQAERAVQIATDVLAAARAVQPAAADQNREG